MLVLILIKPNHASSRPRTRARINLRRSYVSKTIVSTVLRALANNNGLESGSVADPCFSPARPNHASSRPRPWPPRLLTTLHTSETIMSTVLRPLQDADQLNTRRNAVSSSSPFSSSLLASTPFLASTPSSLTSQSRQGCTVTPNTKQNMCRNSCAASRSCIWLRGVQPLSSRW